MTDEIECRVIEFDSSYNKFLSPPVEAGQTKLSVLTSVSLHSVSRLDPILASYEAEFTVTLKWRDERLRFNNLRAESNMNSIRPAETEKIWFPEFYFDNTREKVKNIIDDSAVEGMTEDPLTECCDYGGGEHTKESTKSAPTLKYYKRMKIFSD